ncbi:MAG: DUF6492 family protein [Mariniphaga sp.]
MTKYDIVLLVSEKNVNISKLSIKYLLRFTQYNKLYIITAKKNMHHFSYDDKYNIKLLDENSILPGINISNLEQFLTRLKVNSGRAGWYFQQFLKMGICKYPEISNYYLIWDSDTIMLNPIKFFSKGGKVLINIGGEYHKPYFETYTKITGKSRSVIFSFITEHLMISKSIMNELINCIGNAEKSENQWVWNIMNSIDNDNLSKSGFSEFETYGNFAMSTYPESMEVRPIKYYRYGASKYGMKPNNFDLHRLSLDYAYASFEDWDVGPTQVIARNKIISFFIWLTSSLRSYFS